VLSEGKVVHAGRRTATAEARLVAEDGGALLAHAKTTCLILR
jgi:acyl-coenzyme A thioesterase PaaI-like protein